MTKTFVGRDWFRPEGGVWVSKMDTDFAGYVATHTPAGWIILCDVYIDDKEDPTMTYEPVRWDSLPFVPRPASG